METPDRLERSESSPRSLESDYDEECASPMSQRGRRVSGSSSRRRSSARSHSASSPKHGSRSARHRHDSETVAARPDASEDAAAATKLRDRVAAQKAQAAEDEQALECSAACVTWPFRALYRRIFTDLFEPTDDFIAVARKLCVATAFATSPIVIVIGVLAIVDLVAGTNAVVIGGHASPVSFALGAAGNCLIGIIWIATYFVVRQTREVTDSVINGLFVCEVACCIITSLGWPWFPFQFIMATRAMACIVSSSSQRGIVLGLQLVGYGLSSYNAATRFSVGSEPQVATIEEPIPPLAPENIAAVAVSVLILLLLASLLAEYRARLLASASAIELATTVAEQLQRYDTEAAAATLANVAATVDQQLLTSFVVLIDNLNTYRPHIPTWLLLSSDTLNQSVTSPNQSRRQSVVATEEIRGGRDDARSGADDSVLLDPTTGGSSLRHVTYALLNFSAGSRTSRKVSTAAIEAALDLFSDVVHAQAALTRATIHDFTGETLHVSWNTTHDVSRPQRAALRFVRAVATKVGNKVAVSGAVFSGPARCQFAGAGAIKSFTMTMRWRDALRTAAAFVRDAPHSFVIDDCVYDAVRDRFACRGVAAVSNSVANASASASRTSAPSASASRTSAPLIESAAAALASGDRRDHTVLYEVVGEMQRRPFDDQLGVPREGTAAEEQLLLSCAAVTGALEAAVLGRFSAAAAVLTQLDSSTVGQPLVRRLAARVERCRVDHALAFVRPARTQRR
jgi:hypothetical protein